MLGEILLNQTLKKLDHLACGALTLSLPEGQSYEFSGPKSGPHASIIIHDMRALFSFVAKGDVGMADSYRQGWWDSNNLQDLLILGLMNEDALDSIIHGSLLGRVMARAAYALRGNSPKGSRRNIQEHYDLGNDFYSLWLDSSMTYSSALRNSPTDDLHKAQCNKYDRILDRLGSKSGKLIEIGCGWGGFAERAMQDNDYKIKGITLSNQQHDYATSRLGDKAQISLEDYRAQDSQFDHIVSIEMFEAVGQKYWPTYFDKVKSMLSNKGNAIIQTITIEDQRFDRYEKGSDVLRSYIFPGGMLPSPERFARQAKTSDLRVSDQHFFGHDYAWTLRHWLKNFEQRAPQIKAQGYDDSFIRLWRFYLCSCIAGFMTGRINVMQADVSHA